MAAEHVENAELNLRFMEVIGVGEAGEDGGIVHFSVKELLVEQSAELRRISEKIDDRPTKADLNRLERDMDTKHVAMQSQITALDVRTKANEISLAKIAAVVALVGLLFGGVGTAIALAIVGA